MTGRKRQCVLYHATAKPLKIGARLVARKNRDAAVIEPFFEAARPPTAPSRTKAFYLGESGDRRHLRDELGASSNQYVYSVEPTGLFVRVDPAWVTDAVGAYEVEYGSRGKESIPDRARRRLGTIARNYWSGIRAPRHQGWEWLASGIVVCELVARAPKDSELFYYLLPHGSVIGLESEAERRTAARRPYARGGIDITYRQAKDILSGRLDPGKLLR